MKKLLTSLALAALLLPPPASAWWEKGHRLVGLIATAHLTPVARQNVKALLGTESLADVAAWADDYRPLETQTGGWHFTDIPADSDEYNRDRDCPVQPGVKLGAYNDKWRDCVTDRIKFFEDRLADPKLDPVDRSLALKYVVHFIGDVHQPFHASGVAMGGNGINVTLLGSASCSTSGKCNLHNIWDGALLEHRGRTNAQDLAAMETEIRKEHLTAGPNDPVAWTNASKVLSDEAMVAKGTDLDQAYYEKSLPIIDRQIELAGLRLAAILNSTFTAPPAKYVPPVFKETK